MYIEEKDTIAAIATGMGNSGIGIIRISGTDAIGVADRVFRGKKKASAMETYTAAFGHVVDENENVIDETIMLVMKGPHTYTTEDTVELDCHGGSFVLKRVLERVLAAGARTARPGEFTERAYLGGRIDMTEAEAVMDVINAGSDMALKSSMGQLRGDLRDKINELRECIIYDTAYIESAIDDPENYSLDGFGDRLREHVDNCIKNVDNMMITCENGRLIKEGIRTAIVGRPNVGKSSILNMILGENRAIVTDIEGTTRDTLEETVNINGIVLRLIDTAGIRDTVDIVERMGVDKAKEMITDADLVLFIADGASAVTEDDISIINALSGKKIIALVNKQDLPTMIDMDELTKALGEVGCKDILRISAAESTGKDELYNLIRDMFFSGDIGYNDQIIITNERHKEALAIARESLSRVIESIDAGMGEDFYTIDLMGAYEALGKIIGETLEDDLADKIFREFCMGK
ncbi:MAG: tRNA uridine-5-carboxymethylaminomethyl(34) synthesis GTPase MnmE [Eubacterium sp.]|nr:tRNA uridine-5-carboxymethylaminomethyl(34) synthesis GTPase MnmE [Eubacterium sp.]